ncbi:Partner of Y14 and mago [Aphelenchoides fujianensis]|nr:Partner of Y14 and mago [Aphelenchoides fujianensis]
MIFRIASFYAIGKQLNRLPCLEGKCAESYQKELRSAFPRLNFFPLNKNCPKKKPIAHVPFAKSSPRIFEDPQTLRKHENVTTLHLLTSYLQIHRFFHDVRDEILALFGFSSPLNRKVDEKFGDERAARRRRSAVPEAVHFSFSSDPHFLYVLRANEGVYSLVVLNIFTGRQCELAFRPLEMEGEETVEATEILNFEECEPGVGIVNFRNRNQDFGTAICTLDFSSLSVRYREVKLAGPHTAPTSTRRGADGQVYLLDDTPFPLNVYRLNCEEVERTPFLQVRYDIRPRFQKIDGQPEDFLAINDGIDKTNAELSVLLLNLRTGVVQNFVTKSNGENFPYKCEDRLVESMQTAPVGGGVIAMLSYESKQAEDSGLFAFGYLDLRSLQWTDLKIRLNEPFAHFHVADDSTLVVMSADRTKSAAPILQSVHRAKIGATETLQHIAFNVLQRTFPFIRSMTDRERRQFGIPPLVSTLAKMSDAAGGDKRIKSKDGQTYIPATQRPDGTWRKAVRVKEGYVPKDEKPRYQCKAQIEATQRQSGSKFPVGWSPKELQKQAADIREQQRKKTEQPPAAAEPKSAPITAQDHVQKKIHTIQKKINDIDKLKERIANGELKNPEKTQLEKIERRPQLLEEIDKLTAEMNALNTAGSS